MYFLLLQDGTESPALSEVQVRGWIAAGRATAETPLKRAWDPEWSTVGETPEFTEALHEKASGTGRAELPWCAASLASALVAPLLGVWLVVGLSQWPWRFSPGLGLSTTLFVTLAMAGLAAGWYGWTRTTRLPRTVRGVSLARFGTAACGTALAIGAYLDLVVVSRLRANYTARVQRDLRILQYGDLPARELDAHQLITVLQAHPGRIAETNWCDALTDLPLAPAVETGGAGCWFALNGAVQGRTYANLPGDVVVFFEARAPGWNQIGGSELMVQRPASAGGTLVMLADGRVLKLSRDRAQRLRWKP